MGKLLNDNSNAKGNCFIDVFMKNSRIFGLYNSVPKTENPSIIVAALKFICNPIRSPFNRLCDCILLKTKAVVMVMITNEIQNFGFESCRKARLYLTIQMVEIIVTETDQIIHDVKLSNTNAVMIKLKFKNNQKIE